MTTEEFKAFCRKRREQLAWRRTLWLVIFGAAAIAVFFGDGNGLSYFVTGIFVTLGLSTFADTTFREIEMEALNIGKPEEKPLFADIDREVIT